MAQSIGKESVSYSETFEKRSLNSSLTYLKIKNKVMINMNNVVKSSTFEGYTP
jgi:hypothetical protein